MKAHRAERAFKNIKLRLAFVIKAIDGWTCSKLRCHVVPQHQASTGTSIQARWSKMNCGNCSAAPESYPLDLDLSNIPSLGLSLQWVMECVSHTFSTRFSENTTNVGFQVHYQAAFWCPAVRINYIGYAVESNMFFYRPSFYGLWTSIKSFVIAEF